MSSIAAVSSLHTASIRLELHQICATRLRPFLYNKLGNCPAKLANLVGFAKNRKLGLCALCSVAVACCKQDRQFRASLLHGPREPQAVDAAGHHDIAKHQINVIPLIKDAERGLHTGNGANPVSKLFEKQRACTCDLRIVFDQQDRSRTGLSFLLLGSRRCDRRFVRSWQIQCYPGAEADNAFRFHGAAGLMHKSVDLRQAKPRTFANGLRCKKRIKNPASVYLQNPRACIGHSERNIISLYVFASSARFKYCVFGGNGDGTAVQHRVARVDYEIDERNLRSLTSTLTAQVPGVISVMSRAPLPRALVRTSRNASIRS